MEIFAWFIFIFPKPGTSSGIITSSANHQTTVTDIDKGATVGLRWTVVSADLVCQKDVEISVTNCVSMSLLYEANNAVPFSPVEGMFFERLQNTVWRILHNVPGR